MQLFPNAQAKNNRIKAGQTLTLPQANWPLDTSGPAGTDHFLALVSTYPRDFSAAGFKLSSGYGQLSKDAAAEVARQHGGAQSVFAGKPTCDAPCQDEYGAAMFSSEEIN